MAQFDAAFSLLEEAVELDKGSQNGPAAILKYQASSSAFQTILHSSSTLTAASRDLITQNISKNQARIAALSNPSSSPAPSAPPLSLADAVLVDEFDSLECDADVPTAEVQIVQSVEAIPVAANLLAPTPPPRAAPLPPSGEAKDLAELEERHQQRAAQRELSSAAASKLNDALVADEKLTGEVAEAKEVSSSLGAQAKAVADEYIGAASSYLESLKLMERSKVSSETEIASVRSRVAEILDRVEQLNGGNIARSPSRRSSAAASAPPPTDPDKLTPSEIKTLTASSKIGSKIFMPFLHADVSNPMAFTTLGSTEWEDPDGLLALSDSQKKHFHKFARPAEIARHQRKQLCIYHTISPYTIKQSLVTDCSFIASLCIAAAYERRYRRRLVTGILYPQNKAGGPIYNECGKYVVKLWLNGVARRVQIDDRLPVDRNYNLLCSHTSNSSYLELWVSLLEKAFLKLTGAMSYSFPGSNSGVDLYSLTGWVPERLFFKADDTAADHTTTPERVWERLHSANSFGDCLTTASVGKEISDEEADGVGLVTQHAYGILDVRELRGGKRFLFMKNPWASTGWKGRFSSGSDAWTPEVGRELGYDYAKARRSSDDGLFWITFEDFRHYFGSVHLSWQPSLFKFKYTTHSFWLKSDGPVNDKYSVENNPQYLLVPSAESLRKRSTFYVLITRHTNLAEQQGGEVNDFIACFLYRTREGAGKIIYPNEDILYTGVYTSNQHILLTFDADPKNPAVAIVLRQYKKFRDLTYSISIYSTENFGVGPTENVPAGNKLSVQGAWGGAGSGGASGRSRLFHQNPQYRIEVAEDTDLRVVLSANPKLSVSLSVCRGDKRLDYIAKDAEAFSSGDYRPAVATGGGRLKKGVYVCVVSTWSAGETGAYALEFRGGGIGRRAVKVALTKTEEEMYKHNYAIAGRWSAENGAGCANYGRYDENPIYRLAAGGKGEVVVRLGLKGSYGDPISLNASAFALEPGGDLARGASSVGRSCGLLASSNDGVYGAGAGGVTCRFGVGSGGGLVGIVVSTFEPLRGAEYELKVFSTVKLEFK